MSAGRRAIVRIAGETDFRNNVLEFIHADAKFTTDLIIDGEPSANWTTFEHSLTIDHNYVVILRKPIDDTASQAEYVCVRVGLNQFDIEAIRWITVQFDEDYQRSGFERFVEGFLGMPASQLV